MLRLAARTSVTGGAARPARSTGTDGVRGKPVRPRTKIGTPLTTKVKPPSERSTSTVRNPTRPSRFWDNFASDGGATPVPAPARSRRRGAGDRGCGATSGPRQPATGRRARARRAAAAPGASGPPSGLEGRRPGAVLPWIRRCRRAAAAGEGGVDPAAVRPSAAGVNRTSRTAVHGPSGITTGLPGAHRSRGAAAHPGMPGQGGSCETSGGCGFRPGSSSSAHGAAEARAGPAARATDDELVLRRRDRRRVTAKTAGTCSRSGPRACR